MKQVHQLRVVAAKVLMDIHSMVTYSVVALVTIHTSQASGLKMQERYMAIHT